MEQLSEGSPPSDSAADQAATPRGGSTPEAAGELAAMTREEIGAFWKSDNKGQLPDDEYTKLFPVDTYARGVPVPKSGKKGPGRRLRDEKPPDVRFLVRVDPGEIHGAHQGARNRARLRGRVIP